jgi:hypothetical protein
VPRQVGLAAAIDGRDEFLEILHALLLIERRMRPMRLHLHVCDERTVWFEEKGSRRKCRCWS